MNEAINEAIIEFRYNLPPDEELMAKLVGFRTKLFSLLTLRVGPSNDKKKWNEIKNLHNILLQIKTVAALKKLVKMTKLSLETTHKFEIQNDDVRPLIEWLDALKRKTEPDSLLRKIVENFHDKVISVSRLA